jgi:thiosulfate/3-mercaptopyruvate sulfurtransferase
MSYVRIFLILLVILCTACSAGDNLTDDGTIVSAEWLQSHMNDPDLMILHVGTWEGYDSIRIVGSQFIDPYAFTMATDELRNELPELDSLLALMAGAGVNDNSKIVLYYENEDLITRTARVYLTLDFAGWGDRTHVLNGGLPGWNEKGLASTSGSSGSSGSNEPTRGSLGGEEKVVSISAHELNLNRWNPEYVIIDARSSDEYYGEIDSTVMKGARGHLEGANNLDYHRLLSEEVPYLIRSDEELQKEFVKAGMDYKKTAVFYCGSGVRASLNYMAARHMGYSALLYDGSIEEWEMLKLPLTSPVMDPSKIE